MVVLQGGPGTCQRIAVSRPGWRTGEALARSVQAFFSGRRAAQAMAAQDPQSPWPRASLSNAIVTGAFVRVSTNKADPTGIAIIRMGDNGAHVIGTRASPPGPKR
jgi:hypothetical protein